MKFAVRSTALWGLLVSSVLTGCFGRLQPVTASFRGVPRPMMLSKVTRIGGGTPAARERVGGFEGEAVSMYAESESRSREGNFIVTTRTQSTIIDNVTLYNAAIRALERAPDAVIRITLLRPWSRGFVSFVRSTVKIEGDVVIER
jgi:hypothetical protein